MTDAAIEWWGKAGDQACAAPLSRKRSRISARRSRWRTRWEPASINSGADSLDVGYDYRTNYGNAIGDVRAFSSDETKAAFIKAQQMLAGIEDPAREIRTYWGLWLRQARRANWLGAEDGGNFLARCRERSANDGTAMRLAVLGVTCFVQGDFGKAPKEICKNAIRIYDPQRDHDARFLFNLDAGAWGTLNLAMGTLALGEVEQTRR